MELNMDRFKELFKKYFKENYAEVSRQLKVAPAQIFRIINNKGKAGVTFFGKLNAYCKKHDLNYDDYVLYKN